MRKIISPLSQMLKSGEISSVELTNKYIEAIENDNPKYNAYVSTTFDKAIENAKFADKLIAEGKATALTGIPMTLKDNICSDGDLTTCCSKILEGFRPYYDSTVWSKLKAQGAVMLGKTNMDEFAMGSTSETSVYGAPLNPRNTKHVTGGSSGGVASAVCANLAGYGLGSDTGGSVRQPASFCGIVGLKPTYGAVSRYGLIAYGSSLDQIGVLANSVKDTATVFDAISGVDEHDQTSVDYDFGNISDSLGQTDVKGLKIGVAKEYFEGINEEIKDAIFSAIKEYEKNGAEIIDIKLPVLQQALPVYYIIACAEASSNLGRYDGIRYGYRTENFNDVEEMILKTRTEGFGDEELCLALMCLVQVTMTHIIKKPAFFAKILFPILMIYSTPVMCLLHRLLLTQHLSSVSRGRHLLICIYRILPPFQSTLPVYLLSAYLSKMIKTVYLSVCKS